MPFRAPKNFWEWLLLFSPTIVMVSAAVVWSQFYRPRSEYDECDSNTLWLGVPLIALFLCVFSGFVITKPSLRPSDRIIWTLNGMFIVAAIHFVIVLITFRAFPILN
jgi:hypothetical protein